jgi:hypothetical protein
MGGRAGDIETDRNETKNEGVAWIHMAKDRDQWRDLVNTVKFKFHKSWQLLDSLN